MSSDVGWQPFTATGWNGSKNYFRIIESDALQPEHVRDVLQGRSLGCVARGVVDESVRAQIISRFLTSPARRTRGADAPGEYLGAYHYNKSTDEYLDQTAEFASVLHAVLDVPSEPLGEFRRALRESLAGDGIEFRVARHDGREAGIGVLRSWHGRREFALDPHEDRGQCEDPKQAGFEIQRATDHQIAALNICLDNGPGGELVVWNVRPDETTRRRLGVFYTGSPYPTESLNGVEKLRLDVRPGDIYLFNAAHVHAVEPVREQVFQRVTLSCALGFIDAGTVVSWT